MYDGFAILRTGTDNAPTLSPSHFPNRHSQNHSNNRPPLNQSEGNGMQISRTNIDPTLRGDSSPNNSGEKDANVIFIVTWAKRYSTKEGARITGMTPNGFRKLREGENSISFDKLTRWCQNDGDFAAAYAAHVGLILPGEAEFAGAYTKAVNAYQRMKGREE